VVVSNQLMKSESAWNGKGMILLGGLLSIFFATIGYLRYHVDAPQGVEWLPRTPTPPVRLDEDRFPCLSARAAGIIRNRIVVLRGPDWTLESPVEPEWLPEREIILVVETDSHFLPHPAAQRIRFWITKHGDITHVKIVESSGDGKLDSDALELVTNHKCGPQHQRNCRVQSARILVNM
jgi:TonB family protein